MGLTLQGQAVGDSSDSMCCGNSEEETLAVPLPIYVNFRKSFSFRVHQLPLLSIGEKNEMISKVLYVQKMFPLLLCAPSLLSLPPSARRGTRPLSLSWMITVSWADSLSFVSLSLMRTPYLEYKQSPAVFRIIKGKPISTIINSIVCEVVPDWTIPTSCWNGKRGYLQMEANPLQLRLLDPQPIASV